MDRYGDVRERAKNKATQSGSLVADEEKDLLEKRAASEGAYDRSASGGRTKGHARENLGVDRPGPDPDAPSKYSHPGSEKLRELWGLGDSLGEIDGLIKAFSSGHIDVKDPEARALLESVIADDGNLSEHLDLDRERDDSFPASRVSAKELRRVREAAASAAIAKHLPHSQVPTE